MTDPIQPSRHILTVLHAAERTGPPLLALRFLRWLRQERPSWQLSTLFLDDSGPLFDDFRALGPTMVNTRPTSDTGTGEQHQWLTAGIRKRALERTLSRLGPIDLAHVHCAGSMRVKPMLPMTRVLCHVHELSVGQDFHLDAVARRELPRADRYIAVSEAVRTELLDRFPIEPDLVERQWGFVDEQTVIGLNGTVQRSATSAMLVIGSGVRHWRKAPELFARVAIRAHQLHPQIDWRFQWVGGADNSGLEALLAESDVGHAVQFIPHQVDPLKLYAEADAFFLSAREDAFPLVVVEAAALGRPIVSFENGGAPELIRAAGCGTVVPFPDVDAACDALAELAMNPDLRTRMGRSGREFAFDNLVLSKAAPALLACMDRVLASG